MTNSRLVWGWVITFAGFLITVISPFFLFFPLLYGVPLLIIGIVILVNEKEDEIEQVKPHKSMHLERRKK